MPLRIKSRVKEATTTTGTGAYTVSGAVTAHKTFGATCAIDDFFYGIVVAVDAAGKETGEWEEGQYTYSSANTITRTTIHDSSSNGDPVNWGAGTKHIFMALTGAHLRSITNTADGAVGGGTTTPPPSSDDPRPTGVNSSLYGSLVFRDEFNGSALDSSKWNEAIWYETSDSVKNFSVSGGNLNIWPQVSTDGQFKNRTIDTDGKYSQLYGFFEARMKLCDGYGTWPAFWLFAHPGSERIEIDIMEAYSGGKIVNPDANWGDAQANPMNYAAAVHPTEGNMLGERKMIESGFPALDLSADYHVYGCHWDSTGVQFYFDGQALGSKLLTNGGVTTYEMYILFDLWFGSASGNPNSLPSGVSGPTQGIGNSFQIDYVRSWTLASGGGTSTDPNAAVRIDYCGASGIWGYKSGVGGQVAVTTPQQVASHFPNYVIENKGINSSDSKMWFEGSGVVTLGWNDRVLQTTATHMIMSIGINDASANRPEGDYKYYLDNMVTQARNAGRKMIFQTPNPTSTMNTSDYAQWMRDVGVARNVPVIDVYSWATGYMAQNNMSMATFAPDGIHPSDSMYIAIGDYVASELPSAL